MSTSYMIENASDWTNFTGTVIANRLDGIRIRPIKSAVLSLLSEHRTRGKPTTIRTFPVLIPPAPLTQVPPENQFNVSVYMFLTKAEIS